MTYTTSAILAHWRTLDDASGSCPSHHHRHRSLFGHWCITTPPHFSHPLSGGLHYFHDRHHLRVSRTTSGHRWESTGCCQAFRSPLNLVSSSSSPSSWVFDQLWDSAAGDFLESHHNIHCRHRDHTICWHVNLHGSPPATARQPNQSPAIFYTCSRPHASHDANPSSIHILLSSFHCLSLGTIVGPTATRHRPSDTRRLVVMPDLLLSISQFLSFLRTTATTITVSIPVPPEPSAVPLRSLPMIENGALAW